MAKFLGKTTISFGGGQSIDCKVVNTDEPKCGCCDVPAEITVTIATTFVAFKPTDAYRQIAALPPVRFPKNLAGQLGNRCVRELRCIEELWELGGE